LITVNGYQSFEKDTAFDDINARMMEGASMMIKLSVGLAFMLVNVSARGPCPLDNSIIGFTDWADLKSSMTDFGGTKVICPGATLTLDNFNDNIIIRYPTTIQCGQTGTSGEGCVISGGFTQFRIIDSSVQVRGLTMRGATNAIDVATEGAVLFEDCIFEDNNAGSANALGAAGNIYEGGPVTFDRCKFRRNVAFEGTIDIDGGDASFVDCVFEENTSTGNSFRGGGSAIYVDGGGTVSISNSCFIANSGPSTVFLNSGGLSYENNYGVNNTSTVFSCNAIYNSGDSTCIDFAAQVCGPTVPSSTPSAAPTSTQSMTPTMSPSPPPSGAPSFISRLPTAGPTPRPSTMLPSALPFTPSTMLPSALPSWIPSDAPSEMPTPLPSQQPSTLPSASPSQVPSASPSSALSSSPSSALSSRIPSSSPSTTSSSPLSAGSPSAMPELSPANEPPTSGVRSMAPHWGAVAGMFVSMSMSWIVL
jgi:hypothetical protein